MRKTVVALAMLWLAVLAAGPAAAVTIIQSTAFSASGVPSFDALGVTPFDPSLGTLDRVLVSILGQTTITGLTAVNVISTPAPVPIPYAFQVDVTQDFFGLAGRYFAFADPIGFRFLGNASGAGEAFTFSTVFSYDFTFTAGTDLVGFVPLSPSFTPSPVLVSLPLVLGSRGDFLDGPVPINEIDLVQTLSLSDPTGRTAVTGFTSGGTLQITYDFTPFPVRVTELTVFALLASVLAAAGVFAFVRSRRRRRP